MELSWLLGLMCLFHLDQQRIHSRLYEVLSHSNHWFYFILINIDFSNKKEVGLGCQKGFCKKSTCHSQKELQKCSLASEFTLNFVSPDLLKAAHNKIKPDSKSLFLSVQVHERCL